MLAISGSRSATTQAQIDAAQSYSKVWPDAADFLPNFPKRAALMEKGVRTLAGGTNLLAAVSEKRDEDIHSSRLSRMLAEFAADLIERTTPACLFVAGGDTSSAVVSALDVESLEFARDIDRGVPLVATTSAGTTGLLMVLKVADGPIGCFRFCGSTPHIARDATSA